MKGLRTRLALLIAPWLKQPTVVQFPTIYTGTTSGVVPPATAVWQTKTTRPPDNT